MEIAAVPAVAAPPVVLLIPSRNRSGRANGRAYRVLIDGADVGLCYRAAAGDGWVVATRRDTR